MKVTLLFQNFAKKGASEPPEVDQSNFQKNYENAYCEKTHQNFFNFLPFFNSSIPLEKHINFLQIPFLISAQKTVESQNSDFSGFFGG